MLLILLDAVTATGIIFALGHFYFALVYDAKKYGVREASLLMVASLMIAAGWYVALNGFSSPTRISFFAVSVLFAFILHNLFDLWRFGYRSAGIASSVIGFPLLYLFFWQRAGDIYGIVASLGIWTLVFSHYLFWIFISIKSFDPVESEKFIHETIVVHVAIAIGYMANAATNVRPADMAYSLPFFFYSATLVHVIYSALRQIIKVYRAGRISLGFIRRKAGPVISKGAQ